MAEVGHDKNLPAKEALEPRGSASDIVDEEVGVVHKSSALSRDLKNRHMQSKCISVLNLVVGCWDVS